MGGARHQATPIVRSGVVLQRVEGMANILLVDDEPNVAARNAAALEADGHSVAVVSTAAEAAKSAHRDVPDLVVLEGMLDPDFAGFDLARSLAHDFPTLPLIMLTRADEHLSARARSGQDRDGGWLPVQRYLEKPVSTDVLVYEVDHLLPGAH
jgi:DNA-binding response OmpR family regulator